MKDMIKKEEIELFLHRYVAIGTPHSVIDGKLFFYYGTLIYVDSEELKLETRNGYKIVPLILIKDIHETRRKYG